MAAFIIRDATLEDGPTLMPFARQCFSDTYVGHPKSTACPEQQSLYLETAFTTEAYRREFEEEAGAKFFICEEEYVDSDSNKPPAKRILGYAKVVVGGVDESLKIGTNPITGQPQKPIRLQRLYVGKDFTGRGLGKALLMQCFDFAKSSKCDLIWLGTWGENTAAVEFYKKFGFSVSGELFFVQGNQKHVNLLMQIEFPQNAAPNPSPPSSSPSFIIRDATLEDGPTLMPFARQCFSDTYVGHPKSTACPKQREIYMDTAFTTEAYRREFEEEAGVKFFICEEDFIESNKPPAKRILGYAKVVVGGVDKSLKIGTNPITGQPQKPIRLQRLYVGKDFIGRRGVGKALLMHCFDFAKSSKCDLIWLGTWGENKPAIEFYEKYGFRVSGELYFQQGNEKRVNTLMQIELPL